MNGNVDSMNGMYGSVQFIALTELNRLWSKNGKAQTGSQGLPWKRAALAVTATSVALLLASGTGS
jgi:hypothetical protein